MDKQKFSEANNKFKFGDLIIVLKGYWTGSVGIVSRPISVQNIGHVLVHKDGFIYGRDASIEDIEPIDEKCEGFAQLGYHLIKLGSLVIEQKLIV